MTPLEKAALVIELLVLEEELANTPNRQLGPLSLTAEQWLGHARNWLDRDAEPKRIYVNTRSCMEAVRACIRDGPKNAGGWPYD